MNVRAPGSSTAPLPLCVFLAAGAISITACNRPGTAAQPRVRSTAQTGTTASDVATPSVGNGTNSESGPPVSVLLINSERLEAGDVLRPLRHELSEQARTLSAATYRATLRDKIIAEFREQARAMLLYQEASKRISEREKEAFEGFIDDEIRKQVNAKYGGRHTRYEKALTEQGLTLADDRERIRRQLITLRHLHQTVMTRVTDPTRAELHRFWEEQKDKLSRPERRRMSLIEVPIEDEIRAGSASARSEVTPGSAGARSEPGSTSARSGEAISRTQAADLIAKAKAELDAGGDFAAVARKYSQGVHAENGGAWDFLTRGSVRERWEKPVETLFTLSPGQVSSTIETPEAFFIVRCDEIDAPPPADFAAMQPKLVEAYRDHQFNVLVDERVRELQEQATFVPNNVARFLEGIAQAAPQPQRP